MSSEISKQEYLKRYLEGDDKEKKRKRKAKSVKSVLPKVKIVHENVDIKSIKFGNKEETDEEECPVIAEVVDERPIEIKSKEIYASSRWKRLGEDQSETGFGSNETVLKKETKISKNKKLLPNSNTRHDSDSDLSPERHRSHKENSGNSERKNHSAKKQNQAKKYEKHESRQQRHDSDSDLSPTRPKHPKHVHSNSESDLSPARSNQRKFSNTNSDSDLSPQRANRRLNRNSDSDLSPERMRKPSVKDGNDSDLSPERMRKPSVKDGNDSDLSPPRKTNLPLHREHPSKDRDNRPVKTLSGLKAGLQNAATLREETKEFRKREKTRIEDLDEEVSGRNASTVVRDKRTGQKRNLEDEARVDDEKKKELSEQQQKYEKWGKGLIQDESKNQKLAEDLYETSKPLARYCDDEDLEEKLKAEIHDDDPMAQYMRKKKQKHAVNMFPAYSGPPPPPNRFGIPPGYRWDGVDRSNGFEKKYFEQKSNKKAMEEEAYLWSVQDM